MNSYEKTLARMESEVKRARAQVVLLQMLHRELEAKKKKEKIKA